MIIEWVKTRALLILGLCLAVSWAGWSVHVLRLRASKAAAEARAAELSKVVSGYQIASKWQQDAIDRGIAEANSEYSKKQARLKAISENPMPKTVEEAKEWSLKLLREEK